MCNKNYNKKGSIGITVIMLVFGLLMSVAMSYQKMVQTETMVQGFGENTDRAMDAAYSGINYAISEIQSHKEVFKTNGMKKVTFTNSNPNTTDSHINIKSQWLKLNEEMMIVEDQLAKPPYRFIISCTEDSYIPASKTVCIKSQGEYIKRGKDDQTVASYTAQIMAECKLDPVTRTIKIKRYRKMTPQKAGTNDKFYSFHPNDPLKTYIKDFKE